MLTQPAIDALRRLPIAPGEHLIDGRAAPAHDGGTLEVRSPIDGAPLTTVARGTAEDVDRAVAAARAAFDDGRWRDRSPAERRRVMLDWADRIEAEALALAVLGVRDNGTEIAMALKGEALGAAATIRFYAEAIDKLCGEVAPTRSDVLALVHREPVGVVGAIVPWNFPLMIGAWKLAPALAAGNSVVLKPPESASLSSLRLAELAHEAGLPPGVLNVVTGEGAIAGEALALSMDVDVLAFTGSGATGRRLLECAARSNLKRVYLELGGKSPHVVFDDGADLEAAAKAVANGIFRNSGQVCIAGSRLLVQASAHDELVAAVARHAEASTVGDPLDLASTIGAVHSPAQLERNLAAVAAGVADGAELVTGGNRLHEGGGGTYMAPTILTGVAPGSTLSREEVFGPVLGVTAFDDEAEAVGLANDTSYGLAAGLWTADLSRAHRLVRAIRAGVVHVNTYGGADVNVPMAGHRGSGNGHDKSLHAFDHYLDLKTAWIQL